MLHYNRIDFLKVLMLTRQVHLRSALFVTIDIFRRV